MASDRFVISFNSPGSPKQSFSGTLDSTFSLMLATGLRFKFSDTGDYILKIKRKQSKIQHNCYSGKLYSYTHRQDGSQIPKAFTKLSSD